MPAGRAAPGAGGRGHRAQRVTFRAYAEDYTAWAAVNKRSGWKERYLVARLVTELGDRALEAITTADVERVRDGLLEGRTGATVNRYRDLLSAMFKRALRLGHVPVNPVKGIPKFREAGQRLVFLHQVDEPALHGALPTRLRPAVVLAQHMGFRWSEQAALRWRDVDMLTGYVTVEPAKGQRRSVPINAAARERPPRPRPGGGWIRTTPTRACFPLSHRQALALLTRAVERAQGVIRDGGGDASRLDGFTWHCLRHTFASRLVMAGVDLRTVQELGGWKTLSHGPAVRAPRARTPARRGRPARGVGEVSRKWPEGAEPVSRASGRERPKYAEGLTKPGWRNWETRRT